jgi:hypothetical protein
LKQILDFPSKYEIFHTTDQNTRKISYFLKIRQKINEISRIKNSNIKNLPVSGTGTDGICPVNLFVRNPRILVTTFWGELLAPKIEPPNFENRADDGSPPGLLPSEDATVFSFNYYVIALIFFLFKKIHKNFH